jgi:cell division protein FtsI/penicillin-binding protein 2
VNAGSSAYGIVRRRLVIAGKTGTRNRQQVRVRIRDAAGGCPGTTGNTVSLLGRRRPSQRARGPGLGGEDGSKLKHSWLVGFAPADNPKIAFAVALEYGGSGGMGAGLIAKQMVASMIEHKYLERTANPADAQPASASEPPPTGELLHPAGN